MQTVSEPGKLLRCYAFFPIQQDLNRITRSAFMSGCTGVVPRYVQYNAAAMSACLKYYYATPRVQTFDLYSYSPPTFVPPFLSHPDTSVPTTCSPP
jgi:hypothetical protein